MTLEEYLAKDYEVSPLLQKIRDEYPEGTLVYPTKYDDIIYKIRGEITFNPNNACYCCCGFVVYNLVTEEKARIVPNQ